MPTRNSGEQQLANSQSERYSGPTQSEPATSARTEGNNVEVRSGSEDSTNEPQVLRRPAPYNLASLRDLYTQIPDSIRPVETLWIGGIRSPRQGGCQFAPLDVPIGPDYVLGPGDSLTIDLWGGVSQTLSRVVWPDGHLACRKPEMFKWPDSHSGGQQSLIQEALKRQYRNLQVVLMLSDCELIRVYVVGDVQRPGAYEIVLLGVPIECAVRSRGSDRSWLIADSETLSRQATHRHGRSLRLPSPRNTGGRGSVCKPVTRWWCLRQVRRSRYGVRSSGQPSMS